MAALPIDYKPLLLQYYINRLEVTCHFLNVHCTKNNLIVKTDCLEVHNLTATTGWTWLRFIKDMYNILHNIFYEYMIKIAKKARGEKSYRK